MSSGFIAFFLIISSRFLIQTTVFTLHSWPLKLKSQSDKKTKQQNGSVSIFLPNVSWLLTACVYMVKCRPTLCLWTATVAGRQDISAPSYFQNAHARAHTWTHTHAHTHTHTVTCLREFSFKLTRFFINNVSTGVMRNNGTVFLFYQTQTRNKETEKGQRDGQGEVGLGSGREAHWPDERYIVKCAAQGWPALQKQLLFTWHVVQPGTPDMHTHEASCRIIFI